MRLEYPYPLVRLILPFLLGIIAGLYISPLYFSGWLAPLLLILFLSLFPLTFFSSKARSLKSLTGIFVLLFIAFFGIYRTITSIEINDSNHFSKSAEPDYYLGKVTEEPALKKKSVKTILVIDRKFTSDSSAICTGKTLAYIEQDSASRQLKYGDIIIFSKSPVPIDGPSNPGSFDYKRYMEGRNVFHQVYLRAGEWKIKDRDKGNLLIAKALEFRKKLIGIFEKHGITGTDKAVASALLLGADDEIDPETMKDYSGSGVLHILSVSGMHVGIIYLIIEFTLKILLPGKRSRYLKIIIPLILIWFYSLLSGLSPSVLRAATMFSFLLVAELFNRKIPPENSLAASAFVLLTVNPLMIINVGFQLSFIAVIGIMFIYKMLNEFWQPDNIIVKYIWQLVAVSLAAQLVTAPISIYYFHQFPLYFMLANLVAIPLSTIAMYSGVALLAFSYIPFINSAIAFLFKTSIHWLNLSVKFIDNLPYAVIQHITLDIFGMMLLYLILIFLTIYITNRKRMILNYLIAFFLLLAVNITINYTKSIDQKIIVISHENKNTMLSMINGRTSVIISNQRNDTSENSWHQRSISGLSDYYHVKETEELLFEEIGNRDAGADFAEIISPNFMAYNDCRMTIIDEDFNIPAGNEKFKCNFILLRNTPRITIDSLLNHFSTALIIADGSNKNYMKKKWKLKCEAQGIRFYDTQESGAFIYKVD